MASTLLASHPLLALLAPAHVLRVAAAGASEAFAPGEPIVAEGTLGDALFLILSGQVAVHRGAQTLATLGAGEVFGEMSLVEPAPRAATVTAMQASVLFRLPHEALRALLADEPEVASVLLVHVVKVLSERLRRANALLTSVDVLADWLAGGMV